MADPQTASAGSSPQGAGQAAVPTGWEAEKKRLEGQIQGLSQERSQYKAQADAWGRLAQDPVAQGAIRYGQDGLPMGWDLTVENSGQPAQAGQYVQQVNPLSELGVDPNAANQWVQAQAQSVIARQGYITQPQAQALANQAAQMAYAAANQRFNTMRAVDKLLTVKDPSGKPVYGDLANPASEWSKRTAAYLQQYGAGKPSREGAGWDEWEFVAPQVLQQAADISYAQMVREGQISAVSQQEAIQNQQAAGISAGVTTTPLPSNPEAAFQKAVEGGSESMWNAVQAEIESNWQKQGLLKP